MYLRSPAKKRRKLKYRIRNAKGKFVEQDVRVIAVQGHTVSDLFAQQLFALLPFYLFTHSSERLKELQDSAAGHAQLVAEMDRFVNTLLQEKSLREVEKSQLLELTQQVMRALIRDNTLKAEMENAMNAALIKLSTDEMSDQYEARIHDVKVKLREAKDEARTAKATVREERESAIFAVLQAGLSGAAIRAMYPKLTDEEFQSAFQKAEEKVRQLADRTVEP